MTRQGVPPVNPVFGPSGAGEVAYYYLWHFSAAELALPPKASGWEADIALTGFTAFASLWPFGSANAPAPQFLSFSSREALQCATP